MNHILESQTSKHDFERTNIELLRVVDSNI